MTSQKWQHHIVGDKSESSIAQCIHASIRCRVSPQLMFPALSSVQCPVSTTHAAQSTANYPQLFEEILPCHLYGEGFEVPAAPRIHCILQRTAAQQAHSFVIHNHKTEIIFSFPLSLVSRFGIKHKNWKIQCRQLRAGGQQRAEPGPALFSTHKTGLRRSTCKLVINLHFGQNWSKGAASSADQ